MDLTVILPCYNDYQSAHESANRLNEYLEALKIEFEIIIVDDGSSVKNKLRQNNFSKKIKLVSHERNLGKGAALRTAVNLSLGELIIFTDVDLPYDLDPISRSLKFFSEGHSVIMGTRFLLNSQTHANRPISRSIVSKIQSYINKFYFGDYYDTQCGFKAFRGQTLKSIFKLTSINGYGIDIEIFYLLIKYKIPFEMMPVKLVKNTKSTLLLPFVSLILLFDYIRIVYKNISGQYPHKLD